MLDDAIKFAAVAHNGMKRKGFGQPYIFHPLEVLSLASLITDDEDILTAAILHDTVEDAGVKIEDIRTRFNDRVANLVGYETENKRGNINKADTWLDRKKEAIECLANCTDKGAKIVALCDKVSNLRSFNMLIMKDGDKAWDNFNQKDPKMHYWYYNSIKETLSELKDSVVYMEYCHLLDTIFAKYLKGE